MGGQGKLHALHSVHDMHFKFVHCKHVFSGGVLFAVDEPCPSMAVAGLTCLTVHDGSLVIGRAIAADLHWYFSILPCRIVPQCFQADRHVPHRLCNSTACPRAYLYQELRSCITRVTSFQQVGALPAFQIPIVSVRPASFPLQLYTSAMIDTVSRILRSYIQHFTPLSCAGSSPGCQNQKGLQHSRHAHQLTPSTYSSKSSSILAARLPVHNG